MNAYLDIVDDVLVHGRMKKNRTGIDTIALPNMHFSHNLGQTAQSQDNATICYNFPLLTTKRVAFKTMCVELEGFINGITDKKWYQERGCKIWNEWANPTAQWDCDIMGGSPSPHESKDSVRKQLQRATTDLGPIYGYQWRKFGEHYGPLNEYEENAYAELNGVPPKMYDYQTGGFDQLKYIVDTLKTNPNDRRMVCSAWNPNQQHLQALPPCHLCFVITVIDGVINLHWTQRSCDLMLGVPFNIASYGLLLCLLAAGSELQPGNLSGMLCDCHIYENQISTAHKQLERIPRHLPQVKITQPDIFKWTHKDVELLNYNPYSKIDFGDVAV